MTQSELVKLYGGKTLEELEAMSEADIEKHFAPYFHVTRPTKKLEPQVKTSTGTKRGRKSNGTAENKPDKFANLSPEQRQKIMELRKQYGIT